MVINEAIDAIKIDKTDSGIRVSFFKIVDGVRVEVAGTTVSKDSSKESIVVTRFNHDTARV